MSEARFYGLNYGHLGKPYYDPDEQKWHFSRKPTIDRRYQQLGQPILAILPSSEHASSESQYADERIKNIRGLTGAFPELQPSTPLLSTFAATSEAIEKVSPVNDRSRSDVLAFGQADLVDRHRSRKTVPIVAVSEIELSGSVLLVRLEKEIRRWREDQSLSLHELTAKDGKACHWSEFASPVQQLVFAEIEGRSKPWLAVRYSAAIAILRPLVQRKTEGSCLDPNHIATLRDDASQDSIFTDVAFNPKNAQLLATVDRTGSWSTWSLEPRNRNRPLWRSQKLSTGSAFQNSLSGAGVLSREGLIWSTICWIGNSRTLCVANHSSLKIVDTGGKLTPRDVKSLLPQNSFGRILELRKGPLALPTVFVLTNKAVLWLHISDSDEGEAPQVQTLLSWKHFRDPSDSSLRLNLLREHETQYLDHNKVSMLH